MKQVQLLSLLVMLLFCQTSFAVKSGKAVTPTNETTETTITEAAINDMLVVKEGDSPKVAKKKAKMQKRLEKLEKKMAKAQAKGKKGDDEKKWMRFWLLGWGAGLLLFLLAVVIGAATGSGGALLILWALGGLAWLFGWISLIIWLVKKFS